MLILTRQMGQSIKVGDDIDVTVLGFKGNQVKIGISAPWDVAIQRKEVYLKIIQEQEQD